MSEMVAFDEGSHFISCLQLVDQHMRQRRKDSANVRWIIVGIHDALYTLLIEKITGTDGFGIFNKNFEDQVCAFYASGKSSRDPEYMALKEKSLSQNIVGIGKLLERLDLRSGVQIKASSIETLERPSRGIRLRTHKFA